MIQVRWKLSTQLFGLTGAPGELVTVPDAVGFELIRRGLADAELGPWLDTPEDVWANRALWIARDQFTVFFTDVGVGGSVWTYRGGRWRPLSGQVVLKNLVTDVSNNAGPKVVLDYATIQAGLWQDGDIIELNIIKEKTGGTSDTDATDVMLGTVPATPGTTLNLSTSGLTTTNLSMALFYRYRRVSSTSVRSQAAPGSVGLGAGTSANAVVTGLSNLDSVETYLQVTSDLTTAGGEVSWLRGMTATLIAGA